MRDALIPLLGLALAVPAFARAQELTKPSSTSGANPRSSIWRFELSAQGTWYENAYFLGPAVADTAWSTDGRATLSHERSFKAGSYRFSAFGGALYYPEIDSLNQPTYGGAFDLNWNASRSTKLTLGQHYERSNTRHLSGLDAEGLPLPTSGVEFATSTLGLEQRLSRYWQLAIDGKFDVRYFEDDALVDGKQVLGVAQLGRQLGKRGLFFLSYGYSSAWFGTGKLRAHQALVGGRKQAERGVGFELSGGVGYVESTAKLYPAGRVGLTATGRRATLALLYNRDFGQAFGYGRQMISDVASATLSWTPSQRLSFDASYNFGYRRDPADEDYTVVSGIASLGFRWKVVGGMGFGAQYAWERNETEGFPVVEGGRATASLTYGVDWK
jgi:hypothetical protein